MPASIKVLFVCLGNICRSPLAEGIFSNLVSQAGRDADFVIDSCGTGSWHAGSPPHHDSVQVARAHNISIEHQRARQINLKDLNDFDVIIAMDRSNLDDLLALAPDAPVKLLREFDPLPDSPDVPDPYYGGPDGFQEVFDIVYRCCESLLEEL